MLNETAKTMFENGYVVMPCVDKKPLGQWRKILDANTSEDEAIEAALTLLVESAGYGQLGNVLRNNTFVLDFDSEADYSAFCARFGKPSTMVVKTPNGYHVYYRLDNQPNGTTKVELFEGCYCDFRCANKNYVICAGNGIVKATGEIAPYTISNFMSQDKLQYLPKEIEELIKESKENNKKTAKINSNIIGSLTIEKALVKKNSLEEMLKNANGKTNHNQILDFAIKAGNLASFYSKNEFFEVLKRISQENWNWEYLSDDSIRAFNAGYDIGAQKTYLNLNKSNFDKTDSGKLVKSWTNLDLAIKLLGDIEYNLWTEEINFINGEFKDEYFDNILFTTIKTKISDIFHLNFKESEVEQQIYKNAIKFNPIERYLKSLKWDGKKRVEGWLSRTIGCENDEICKLAEDFLFIASIKRAIETNRKNGVKVDECLIFIGSQGSGKSRIIRSLFGDEYLNTTDVNMDQDRIRQQAPALGRSWVVELGELNSLTKAKDFGMVKNYLSQENDTYTPVYQRTAIKKPRHCIFIGTTNETEFLCDPTGNRRFIPIEFKKRLTIEDQKRIAEERDQLWAEAYKNYLNGAKYLPNYELINRVAEKYEVTSSVDEQILKTAKILATTRENFTVNDVLDLMGVQIEKKKMFDKQIGATLRKAGYEKRRNSKTNYYIGTKQSDTNILEFPEFIREEK